MVKKRNQLLFIFAYSGRPPISVPPVGSIVVVVELLVLLVLVVVTGRQQQCGSVVVVVLVVEVVVVSHWQFSSHVMVSHGQSSSQPQ